MDSLLALGKETPVISMGQARMMGEALRKMAEAVRHFEMGRRRPAEVYARESAESLDATVAGLLNTCNSMSMSSCPNPSSSCQNQLQGLAQQQSQLNRQTQGLLGQAQSQRLSASQGEELMRLAARQEMIRRGLEEVSQELGDQRNILGRLDDLVEEMEEATREMRRRDARERIMKRQERILSRLLTAQRSIRREDQREERISRPGRPSPQRTPPPPLRTQRTLRDALLRGILRGGQDPIPAEYRRLVEEYWKALMASP
jgi:hypothetical protein